MAGFILAILIMFSSKNAISNLKQVCEKYSNVLIVVDENTFGAAMITNGMKFQVEYTKLYHLTNYNSDFQPSDHNSLLLYRIDNSRNKSAKHHVLVCFQYISQNEYRDLMRINPKQAPSLLCCIFVLFFYTLYHKKLYNQNRAGDVAMKFSVGYQQMNSSELISSFAGLF